MTAWEVQVGCAEWARGWDRWCATMRAPGTPTTQYAAVRLEGSGQHTRLRPRMIGGADLEELWDAASTEWLQAAPEPHAGWGGDVSSLLWAPLPPRLVLHAANPLRPREIHTWGCDTATVWCLPPEDGGTRLTLAHFKKGGPTYDDTSSRLGDVPGALLLMLPTNLAAALRREPDGSDGTPLALLHRRNADECRWDAFLPHLTGRHTYMTAPQGHPR